MNRLNNDANNFMNSISNNLNNIVNNNNKQETNIFIKIIKLILILVVSLIILYLILLYVFKFDLLKWLGFKKNIKTTQNPFSKEGKQVFHIKSNKFTYNDSKHVCKKYNSELATVEQLIKAWKKGANWCNYGWSKDQLALYPIQKKYWEKQLNNNKNTCGEPGINGGYFENSKLSFGVNCYGKKPKPKFGERIKNSDNNNNNNNDNKIKIDLNKVVISPFNRDKWSEFQ